jgi:hypothetical protein
MRTNRARHGFLPAMRASTDRRRGRECLAAWCKAQCARSSAKRKSSHQAAQGYPSPRRRWICRPSPACTRPSGAGRSREPFAVRLRLWAGRSAASPCWATSTLALSERVLDDAPLVGTGAGTFAALASIYREIDDRRVRDEAQLLLTTRGCLEHPSSQANAAVQETFFGQNFGKTSSKKGGNQRKGGMRGARSSPAPFPNRGPNDARFSHHWRGCRNITRIAVQDFCSRSGVFSSNGRHHS